MSERARDYAYEALAEVTSTDWTAGRGELNAALKSIREQTPELEDSFLLAAEIHDRAKAYAVVMGEGILLTPTALAKHWQRVVEQAPKPTYTPPSSDVCETCAGDKMVVFRTRADGSEEMAPCPSCNVNADAGFWRHDSTRFQPPDPARVRERMTM